MRLKIAHSTNYTYEAEVNYGLQKLRLTPRSQYGQKVVSWTTTIEGGKHEVEYQDHLNNHTELVSFKTNTTLLKVTCEGEIETSDNAGVIGPHKGYTPLWYFLRSTDLTEPGEAITEFVDKFKAEWNEADEPENEINKLHELSSRIAEAITYERGATTSETTAEEALKLGKGVCQDHAHTFISAARALGHPARYVSGYLFMSDRIDQNACHGWAEAHIENLGWVGFDVSNAISPDESYVRIAIGLDFLEAAPIAGLRMSEAPEEMVVSLQVQQ